MGVASCKRAAWVFALAFVGTGCGGKDQPVPVRGTVTLDGKPVAGAAVHFVPDQGGSPASAETQADGSYSSPVTVSLETCLAPGIGLAHRPVTSPDLRP